MRHIPSALVGLVLVGYCCCPARSEEQGSRWWPFGSASDTESPRSATVAGPEAAAPTHPQTPPSSEAAEADPERRWMISSQRGKISWPRVHMPELPKPRLPRPQFVQKNQAREDSRNAWLERQPEPSRSSPLEAIGEASRRAGDRTRTAWRKTVDALTPGDSASSSSRMAQRNSRPSLWKRMFGAEEPQPQGPQTVTEWMAQDRLDP